MRAIVLLLLSVLSGLPLLVAAGDTLPDTPAHSPSQGLEHGYWSDHGEGWFWYRSRPPIPPPAESVVRAPEPAPIEADPVTPDAPKVLSTAWLRENLPKYRDRALDNPSPSNVRLYLYLQRAMMDKAQRFAKVTQTVVYQSPELDETSRNPITHLAKQAARRQTSKITHEVLTDVASRAGIWFFYASNCPYCHTEAPVLKMVEREYGFKVLPIALDGKYLPDSGYTDFVTDRGQSKKLNVVATPTMFLVAPPNSVVMLGQGVMAKDELEDRIVELAHQSGWVSDAVYAKTQMTNYDFLPSTLPAEDPSIKDDPAALLQLLEAAANTGGMTPYRQGTR